LRFQNAVVVAQYIYIFFIFIFFEMLNDTERSEIKVNFYCANNFVDFKWEIKIFYFLDMIKKYNFWFISSAFVILDTHRLKIDGLVVQVERNQSRIDVSPEKWIEFVISNALCN